MFKPLKDLILEIRKNFAEFFTNFNFDYLISKFKNSTNKDENKNDSLDFEIFESLEKIEKEFKEKFLAYHLMIHADKNILSGEDKKNITEKYGSVRTMPFIEWGKHFGYLGENYNKLHSVIKKYLSDINYRENAGQTPTLRFELRLSEIAEGEAKKIIENAYIK